MIRTVLTRATQSAKYAFTTRTFITGQCNISNVPTFSSVNVLPIKNNTRFFSDESGEVPGKGAGTVKWFDVKKGFGFISPNDGSPDVFVHHSVVHAEGFRSLADGEEVEFESSLDDRGRIFASTVTGPDGEFVKGAPRQFDRPFGNDGGFGGGGGGGGGFGGDGGGFGGGGGGNGGGFGGDGGGRDGDRW